MSADVGDKWAIPWRGTGFAAPGPAALPRGDRRRLRSTFLRRDQDGLCRGPDRAFARCDSGAVAADVPDQFILKVLLDERLMHPFRQTPLGKLLESAREGGFGGQLPAQGETTDTSQGAIYHQALDQSCRDRQTQYGLGHEGVRQPGPLKGRATHSTPGRLREFLDAHPFQRVDDFLQLRRQRTRLVLQLGQQFVLNHVPSLHDQFASGSIHLAGVMMCWRRKPHHARNGRLYPPLSPPQRKIRHAVGVLQEALLT